MGEVLLQGFGQAAAPSSLLATAIGSVLGIVVGMIPGMTISTGIIIVLPLTFVLDPSVSIALLLGLYVGGMLGGSFAAIMLNIPGTPSAAATAIDGHPMVARGEAGRALGVAVLASFIGGLFSALCLFLIAPRLADIALGFRAPDLFSLVLLGLTVICSFAAKSWIKGLLSALIGLAIVSIGQDPVMGTARFTFGSADLLSGINFLTALIGLFAIPQLIDNLGRAGPDAHMSVAPTSFGRLIPTWADIRRIRVPVAIGSVVGTFLGILPGAGGPIAAFLSYDYARKASKEPETFGHGAVEGVAAPESANNAVTGGALVPMMTLGIPGDPVTAILVGALLIHGLAPGPLLFIERPDFAYGVIFSFFWANIFNLIIALAGLRMLVKLIAMPKTILMPAIAILCVVGAYSLRNSVFDIYVMLFFGLLGLGMRWLEMPVVPLLLALVLGRQLEENLRVALTGSQGDISVFFTSPFSVLFLSLAAVSVVWSIVSSRRSAKGAR
ncbi:MAG: tripartite tricarboxylate transporter permease [Gammaproteobacteria bacterium]|nr:tripartite tricarboxylate transporter permease [Gammaproteobacteria bacterium]MDH3506551.1 tripartite tricarboxylate transporter permease [Gammaproteobacteria bacterium]